jgi:uncharacterized protein DUF4249
MKKQIYFIISLLVVLIACTEDFPVDLDSTFSRLVVQGSINNERKAHQVYITKSGDYFDNTPAPKVTGATVTISDGTSVFNLNEVNPGIYETDTMAGEINKTYTLSINTGGKDYTASCYLNYCAPMDSINFGYYDYGDNYEMKDTFIYVLLNALEPETPDNYYLWNVYKNDTLETDTLFEKVVYDDQFVNGKYMYDLAVQWVEAGYKDTITLEMFSITKEYSEYYSQVMDVTVWNMGPLGGPPANPVGNISEVIDNNNDNDNPVGFFLAYSVQRITDIIPSTDERIELEWY